MPPSPTTPTTSFLRPSCGSPSNLCSILRPTLPNTIPTVGEKKCTLMIRSSCTSDGFTIRPRPPAVSRAQHLERILQIVAHHRRPRFIFCQGANVGTPSPPIRRHFVRGPGRPFINTLDNKNASDGRQQIHRAGGDAPDGAIESPLELHHGIRLDIESDGDVLRSQAGKTRGGEEAACEGKPAKAKTCEEVHGVKITQRQRDDAGLVIDAGRGDAGRHRCRAW